MYKLIGHPRSRALRVLWALEEMGLDYEYVPAAPRSDEVIALNGTGKIPVLISGDTVISDSVAILTYLADKHGQLTHPAGTEARARQDALTNYIVAEVDAALWLAAKHTFALPQEYRVPEVKATARYEFGRAMDHLEKERGDGPFLTGDTFTIPDLILSQCAGWALTAKFDLPGGEMGDYLKSLRKRPAAQRAMEVVAAHS